MFDRLAFEGPSHGVKAHVWCKRLHLTPPIYCSLVSLLSLVPGFQLRLDQTPAKARDSN